MPYVITTVALDYDPKQWFAEPREFTTPGEWDLYTRYGKMHFIYEPNSKLPLEQYRPDKILFIVRPGEIELSDPSQVLHKIPQPDGKVTLLMCRP